MKGTWEKPYASMYGSFAKGTLFTINFQYPNEAEKEIDVRGANEVKDFVQWVKGMGATINKVTSYYNDVEKDVTKKYNK